MVSVLEDCTMASRYFISPRIWLSRRLLRPPAASISQQPSPRLFTSNSSLLSMNPQKLRPSVPFLSPTNISNQPTHIYILSRYRSSFASLLTPERKRWLKHEGRSFVRYNLYIFAFIGLGFIIYAGVQMETLDRVYPAPREWSLTTRLWYSWACNLANEKTYGRGIVDWARVGSEMTDVLHVLEDPKKKEGKDTQATLQDDGQIYVEGVGKAGLDISLKSEPWRRGYYDVLFHLARAAENLDGWVRDTTRNIAFPPEVVTGPSNPNPKNVPYGAAHPPLEDNCVPAWDAPEVYYMKLLTTQGFSTRQRLDAAIAWADWLDFKGLKESAEATYDWALDIAMAALPMGANNAVDIMTGIISADATFVSQNLLHTCTALGTHHARNNDLAQGLPILLSVLRARRTLSATTTQPTAALEADDASVKVPFTISNSTSAEKDSTQESAWSWFDSLKTLIMAPEYPPAAPDYDLPPIANTPDALCAEATLTAHIGEVLFAGASSFSQVPPSSSSSASGAVKKTPSNNQIAKDLETKASALAWTREAVDLAQLALIEISTIDAKRRRKPSPSEAETRRRCQECLEMALRNWETMLERIVREQSALASRASLGGEKPGKSGRGWFSLWGSGGRNVDVVGGVARWEQERMMLEERKPQLKRLLEDMQQGDEVRGIAGKILGDMT